MATAERAALPQLGDTVAGKYRIERVIGSGGMGVVFGTTHVVTGKRFAIKWLAPAVQGDLEEAKQRFIREAQVAGRFQHPNVVEVYDIGQTQDGAHFMLMEWLEGEVLSARLERTGALSLHDTCACLLPCMRAIEDAHAAGIVHRDLKPANIFICRANKHGPERAKVLDFGIAKLAALTPGEFNPALTQKGAMIGTPYYLAPEQLRQLPVDARADVYAFGVILYQLLTGNLPFYAENFAELVLQIATCTPPSLRAHAPELSEEIEAVVARAMAREPGERFQEMRGLIDALEHMGAQGKGAGGGRARLGLGLAVLVGAALSIGWYMSSNRREGPALNVVQAATAAEMARPQPAAALDAPPGERRPPPSAAETPRDEKALTPSAAEAPPGDRALTPSAAESPSGALTPSAAERPSGERRRPRSAADAALGEKSQPPSAAGPSSALPPEAPTPAARRAKRAASPAETPEPAVPHNPLRMQIQ